MVVTSANSDLYSPFSRGSMPEESGPSSEEGSGLHSPIFGVQYANQNRQSRTPSLLRPHPDAPPSVRYRTEHDIQNAVGILTSQFDPQQHHQHHYPPMNHHGQLLDATLEPGPNSTSASSRYPEHMYPGPRGPLGLEIPVQTLSNTRLPPPPGQVYFDQSPDGHRQHYPPPPQDAYGGPGSGGGPGGMHGHMDHQHAGQQQQPQAPGSATSSGREPRKESSGVVIACRQWYVPLFIDAGGRG